MLLQVGLVFTTNADIGRRFCKAAFIGGPCYHFEGGSAGTTSSGSVMVDAFAGDRRSSGTRLLTGDSSNLSTSWGWSILFVLMEDLRVLFGASLVAFSEG